MSATPQPKLPELRRERIWVHNDKKRSGLLGFVHRPQQCLLDG